MRKEQAVKKNKVLFLSIVFLRICFKKPVLLSLSVLSSSGSKVSTSDMTEKPAFHSLEAWEISSITDVFLLVVTPSKMTIFMAKFLKKPAGFRDRASTA
jgi:hypothetical protein